MANELLESLAKRLEAEPELRESLCNDIKVGLAPHEDPVCASNQPFLCVR